LAAAPGWGRFAALFTGAALVWIGLTWWMVSTRWASDLWPFGETHFFFGGAVLTAIGLTWHAKFEGWIAWAYASGFAAVVSLLVYIGPLLVLLPYPAGASLAEAIPMALAVVLLYGAAIGAAVLLRHRLNRLGGSHD
jgi:hypothetical protein